MAVIGGASGRWFIVLTLLIALTAEAIPIPENWQLWQPQWLLICLFYWLCVLPYRMHIAWIWILGLFYDALMGNLLGLHALTFSLIAYMALTLQHRLRVSSCWQQAFYLVLFALLDLLIGVWMAKWTDSRNMGLNYWIPLLTSLAVWPVIYYFLRRGQHYFRLA